MLETLGRNRITVLIVLALLCAGSAYGLYQYLVPKRVQQDGILGAARSALETKRAEFRS